MTVTRETARARRAAEEWFDAEVPQPVLLDVGCGQCRAAAGRPCVDAPRIVCTGCEDGIGGARAHASRVNLLLEARRLRRLDLVGHLEVATADARGSRLRVRPVTDRYETFMRRVGGRLRGGVR